MAWINVVSRQHISAATMKDFGRLKAAPGIGWSLGVVERALAAIGLGNHDVLGTVARRGRAIYEGQLERELNPALVQSLHGLGTILRNSCIFHMAGMNQEAVWRTMLTLGTSRQQGVPALLDLVSKLADPASARSPEKRRPRALKYPRDLNAFVRGLPGRSTDVSLDIVNSPDHPDYVIWMAHFRLPLAILRGRELGCDPVLTLSRGARPERRGELLYRRTQRRPPFETKVSSRAPKTWFGFDALERSGDDLLVYHYIGLSWAAPLCFEPDLDAFVFLKSLPYDWKDVQKNVSKRTWVWIEQARRDGRCTHVVVYDPTDVWVQQGAPEAAGAHYGVKLVTKSIFDV
jgi:hypothetical protein